MDISNNDGKKRITTLHIPPEMIVDDSFDKAPPPLRFEHTLQSLKIILAVSWLLMFALTLLYLDNTKTEYSWVKSLLPQIPESVPPVSQKVNYAPYAASFLCGPLHIFTGCFSFLRDKRMRTGTWALFTVGVVLILGGGIWLLLST